MNNSANITVPDWEIGQFMLEQLLLSQNRSFSRNSTCVRCKNVLATIFQKFNNFLRWPCEAVRDLQRSVNFCQIHRSRTIACSVMTQSPDSMRIGSRGIPRHLDVRANCCWTTSVRGNLTGNYATCNLLQVASNTSCLSFDFLWLNAFVLGLQNTTCIYVSFHRSLVKSFKSFHPVVDMLELFVRLLGLSGFPVRHSSMKATQLCYSSVQIELKLIKKYN